MSRVKKSKVEDNPLLFGTVIQMVNGSIYVTNVPLGAILKIVNSTQDKTIIIGLHSYDKDTKTLNESGKIVAVVLNNVMDFTQIPYYAKPVTE